jgi:hypothetical protein
MLAHDEGCGIDREIRRVLARARRLFANRADGSVFERL